MTHLVALQELDFLLIGDSIFESVLGTSVGHKVARAEGVPEVWSRFHSDSIKQCVAMTGTE